MANQHRVSISGNYSVFRKLFGRLDRAQGLMSATKVIELITGEWNDHHQISFSFSGKKNNAFCKTSS